jgi:hypothetical protein
VRSHRYAPGSRVATIFGSWPLLLFCVGLVAPTVAPKARPRQFPSPGSALVCVPSAECPACPCPDLIRFDEPPVFDRIVLGGKCQIGMRHARSSASASDFEREAEAAYARWACGGDRRDSPPGDIPAVSRPKRAGAWSADGGSRDRPLHLTERRSPRQILRYGQHVTPLAEPYPVCGVTWGAGRERHPRGTHPDTHATR